MNEEILNKLLTSSVSEDRDIFWEYINKEYLYNKTQDYLDGMKMVWGWGKTLVFKDTSDKQREIIVGRTGFVVRPIRVTLVDNQHTKHYWI